MADILTDAVLPADHASDVLATDHLRKNIKVRTMSGAIASAGGQGGQLVLTVAYNAILARLISPRDFGLVAMAMVVAGFLQVFKDAGLSTATIQREDITNAQVSNLFWVNVAVGGAATLGMAAAAPLVAWFFRQPELVNISIALSIGFLLEGLVVQHIAILNRQMRFTLLSGVELGCAATGFLVGAIMALRSWGYWSLVGATLFTAAFRVTTVWTVSRWRPQGPVRGSGTRPLVRFGRDLTLVGVVYAVSRGCDSLLIGRSLGSEAVGLYSRATALMTRPLERLLAPIYAVTVPAFSRLQTEPERYRSAFVQLFEGLAIAAFCVTGLLFPLSDAVIRVILGNKWDAAAPIFAALTIAFASRPLATATSWLYTSQGRGRDLLVTACIEGTMVVGAFLCGLPFGPTGVAIAYSAASVFAVLPLTFYIGGRRGPVATRDLWFATIMHLPILATVLATTWLARAWTASLLSPLLQVVVCSGIGGAAGVISVFMFARSRRAMTSLLAELKELTNNRTEEFQVEAAP
jgi:PST family polysaccharide transporter